MYSVVYVTANDDVDAKEEEEGEPLMVEEEPEAEVEEEPEAEATGVEEGKPKL